jgi:1,4-alpha-glucan branching enzyme
MIEIKGLNNESSANVNNFFEHTPPTPSKVQRGESHLYQWRGAHADKLGTHFQVCAPNALDLQLVLTAYGNVQHVIPMQRGSYGLWEVYTKEAHPGATYRFHVCDAHRNWGYRTDPFGVAIKETQGVAESVVPKIGPYPWNDGQWMRARSTADPLKRPLSIYELSVESWKKKDGRTLSFYELAHEIVAHHKVVAFTHVELYGVLDHKSTSSWGYQVDHFFATNRRMGGNDEEGFKFFVDLCHQNGIGVILDWIPAHYKHEHLGDLSQSLHYYDGTDLFSSGETPWGTMHFDFGKEEARRLLLASALYWLEVMHVDGVRVDAVAPMLHHCGYQNEAAASFLKELNCIAHKDYPGILMIAEDSHHAPNLTKPVYEGGLGFDAKVGIHLQNNICKYFKSDYEQRYHVHPVLANFSEVGGSDRWMLAHSHDDAASGDSHQHSTLHSMMPTGDSFRRFADMRLFHALNLCAPGTGHLMHMGDEIGQIWAWSGRLNASEGAVEWHLLDGDDWDSGLSRNLLHYVGALNRFYCAYPAFWECANQGYSPIGDHSTSSGVVGWRRFDASGGRLDLFCNCTPMGYKEYDFPLFPVEKDSSLHRMRDVKQVFNSDEIRYGGTGQFGTAWAYIVRNESGAPTHFRFALPPLSFVAFEERVG